jgi:membrane protease YdiL (CAAX protease family)
VSVPGVSTPFLTDAGRVRLGWRLSGFFGVALLVGGFLVAALPSGVVGGAAALLMGALVAGWCLLRLDDRGPGALGFHVTRDAWKEAGYGITLGVLIGIVVVGLMALTGGVRWVAQPGDLVGWLSGAGWALLFLTLPAAAEEALLRGYPLQALTEAWGAAPALGVTSVAFGLLHLGNPGLGALEGANLIAAGLLLGVIYVRTLSLWWATGVHLGWNWAHGYLADVPVSGLEVLDAPLYDGMTAGPSWLGGGVFGPEGSIVATVVLLGATAVCWWGPWLRPGRAARAAGALVGNELNEGKD